MRVAVCQLALHPAAVLERGDDGQVQAPPPGVPRPFARQPEQIALTGELRDQGAKALPRLGWEVGQRGGMEHADGRVRTYSRCSIFRYSVPRPRWQWATSGRMPSSSARARAWR
jgi:hypothetical protein